ncbi:NUDIX hydrolase, partial [Candidatus Gottesmanbacteria bacterium]|nr:NUDIX hydrolase [Candidatus Gottesmanbacteria bacterium]
MHKLFYASGFLYHSPSQQILLQQLTSDTDAKLVMFGGRSHNGNDPQAVFQHCVEKALGVTVPASSIHPVYDYIHDRRGEHFIFYVEVAGATPKTYASKNKAEWFLLSKLSKQAMSEQTRHDIIIGERVIRSL